jgi:hypothetical protein
MSLRNELMQNGPSGHTYRLESHGPAGVDAEMLSGIRYYAMSRGHVAVAGAFESRVDDGGNSLSVGFIKLNPELSPEEAREIEEAGFSIRSHPRI